MAPRPGPCFVPAQVKLFPRCSGGGPTAEAHRHHRLLKTLCLRERDISLINQGYLTSVDQAIGQKLTRRPVVTDQVLTLVHLEQAEVIRKGDQVVISASSGGLNVGNAGQALSNGGMSEQIRVKNLNSNRVIKARVRPRQARSRWRYRSRLESGRWVFLHCALRSPVRRFIVIRA